MGLGIGGIGAALDGAQQGLDHAQDRDFLQGQRDFQQGQQQRAVQQQQREDQQRTAMQGIDDNAPEDVQMRAAAAAYKATDPQKWLELHQKADQLMWQRSARQTQTLLATADSMDTGELANQAAKIWNNANMPVTIANPRYDANSGALSFDATPRDGGPTTTKTFANKDQFLNGLRALTDPTTYANLQSERAKAALKVQEEQGKPTVIPAGASLAVGGKVVATNNNGMVQVGTDNDGNPIFARGSARIGPDGQPIAGGAGGTGTGAGKGGKGPTGNPSVDAQATLDTVLQHSGEKPDAATYAAAKENVGRITAQNPKVPAEMAARVALDLAKDPNKAVPAIDPETGKIDLVYDDGVNGKIKVNVGVGDAVNVGSVQAVIAQRMAAANGGKTPDPAAVQAETRRALTTMTKSMMDGFDPKSKEQYRMAAFDPVERRKMDTSLQQQAEKVIKEASAGKTPEQAAAIRTAVEKSLSQRKNAVDNVVNLVYNYGEKPQSQQQKPSGFQAPRGFAAAASYTPDPNSPAGRAAAARQKAQQASSEKESQKQAQQAQLSTEFQKDSKTMSAEDLVRKYDAMRGQLPLSDLQALKQFEQKL